MTPVSLRHETTHSGRCCAAPGCANTITMLPIGRPARFCCDACRARAYRLRRRQAATPVRVEVDMGSASSRGRPPERAWLVRLRRSDQTVIVAIGLRRRAAERLAQQISDLLDRPDDHGGR